MILAERTEKDDCYFLRVELALDLIEGDPAAIFEGRRNDVTGNPPDPEITDSQRGDDLERPPLVSGLRCADHSAPGPSGH